MLDYFWDHLEETDSSTGTYFEESASFNSTQNDSSLSIKQMEGSLAENDYSAESSDISVNLSLSDIRLKNISGNRLQVSVPLRMFNKKLIQTLNRI